MAEGDGEEDPHTGLLNKERKMTNHETMEIP